MLVGRRILSLGACAAMLALAGCAADDRVLGVPSVRSTAAPKITAEQLVGRWGLGAYHRDTDRARTITQARQQCGNAYVIAKGTNGGVMMHVADSSDLFELQVRVGGDGKTYLGPDGQPAGSQWDREIVSVEQDIITARWVDKDNVDRYGTMVFVRCGGR
jgi:hypothetical protein